MKKWVSMFLVVLLSGCAAFTSPQKKPLLTKSFEADTDSDKSYAVAATDANRRVAIIDILNGKVCVEPPPEAANTISEAFTALFEADVKDKGALATSLSKSISQNISQLYRRTQVVQLYRDSVFALCQSALNGTIVLDPSTIAVIPNPLRRDVVSDLNSSLLNREQQDALENLLKDGNLSLGFLENFPDKLDLETSSRVNKFLVQAELRRRLVDGLKEAFVTLTIEMPDFYATEKLRFIVELSKPVEVCDTQTTFSSEGDDDGKQKIESIETTCHVKIPEGIDEVVSAYVKALHPTSAH